MPATSFSHTATLAAVALALTTACANPPASPDARAVDARPPVDAAPAIDAGPVIDAAPAIDAGTLADATPAIDGSALADAATCVPVVTSFPILAGAHVPTGTVITTWSSNPPSSGAHFGQWAKWNRTYDETAPIARGNYVHNLEHGGVIFLYNCPSGCPADVAALEALMAAIPVDPGCVAPITSRTFITADPLLPPDVRIAATAWGFTYTASCFDEASLFDFVVGHYALGPENFCSEGQVPP